MRVEVGLYPFSDEILVNIVHETMKDQDKKKRGQGATLPDVCFRVKGGGLVGAVDHVEAGISVYSHNNSDELRGNTESRKGNL